MLCLSNSLVFIALFASVWSQSATQFKYLSERVDSLENVITHHDTHLAELDAHVSTLRVDVDFVKMLSLLLDPTTYIQYYYGNVSIYAERLGNSIVLFRTNVLSSISLIPSQAGLATPLVHFKINCSGLVNCTGTVKRGYLNPKNNEILPYPIKGPIGGKTRHVYSGGFLYEVGTDGKFKHPMKALTMKLSRLVHPHSYYDNSQELPYQKYVTNDDLVTPNKDAGLYKYIDSQYSDRPGSIEFMYPEGSDSSGLDFGGFLDGVGDGLGGVASGFGKFANKFLGGDSSAFSSPLAKGLFGTFTTLIIIGIIVGVVFLICYCRR